MILSNQDGARALHFAARKFGMHPELNQFGVLRLLIAKKADVNAQDKVAAREMGKKRKKKEGGRGGVQGEITFSHNPQSFSLPPPSPQNPHSLRYTLVTLVTLIHAQMHFFKKNIFCFYDVVRSGKRGPCTVYPLQYSSASPLTWQNMF